MITTVLIDIDNTLLDFGKCSRQAMISACDEAGIEFSEKIYSSFHKINDGLWIKIENGKMTRDELHAARWQLIFDDMGINFDGKYFESLFIKYLHEGHEPVEYAEEAVRYLSKKYVLAVASNGPYEQQKHRLTLANMIDCFSYLFVSDDVGYAKPSKMFFEECFKILPEKDKNNIIIIGDSPTADILGGINSGIKTCYFDFSSKGCGELKPDYTVHSLNEVKNIL